MVDICLIFKEITKPFSKVIVTFYIPAINIEDFQLLHILSTLGAVVFILVISLFVWWYFNMSFHMHFSSDIEYLFM